MVPCPDPNCEGENKPKAKFCSECGRPLSSLSRTSTPAMTPFSPQFNPYISSPHQAYYGQQAGYDPTAQQATAVPAPAPEDPLQRNKGCPLATFGFGGKLCLMFPSKLNIQDANAKIMPGLVQVKQVKELVLPNVTPLSDFVGAVLMDDSVDVAIKKQEAVAYMDRRTDGFYNQLQTLTQESADYYHLESKILLWQLVKLLIQEDFAGDSERKDEAIRLLLQPGEFVVEGDTLAMVRNYLLQGDKSSATQYAIQEKMWAHGLIIGKSIDQITWRTVVDQFLEQALSTTVENEHIGFYQNALGDRASLRVLYSLFAGAGADAVSHFIPKYSSKSVENQLSEWRETVALILANRTDDSNELIKRLGDLLKENGWVDAAEICFAVSSNLSHHVDNDLLSVELLGSQDGEVSAPLDSLYLTELYEFALSLDQQQNAAILPFLQGYKLVHAWWLADAGYIQEASCYLRAIINGLLSHEKPTPYMHQGFLENLREFSALCRGSIEASVG
ncbi:Sec23-binding domain of Sec16-domain-containing protein [Absidia repens]|uniref:Protein transport protein sec16 n=1 Tax=Absidia repens TaxID=90262 RepID=A0A1X2IS02_9FUNG|nr:Sec23-binding domain of Sec16-domain-containing protein [Absidia repens]